MRRREYVVTANRRQGGVTLSLRGSWGNLPHPDLAAARIAAEADACGEPYTLERSGC